MRKPLLPSFWITNISNQDIMLSDLGLTIRSFTSINLLDHKHYPYLNLKMIQSSEISGSLFKKRNKVVHRKVAPIVDKPKSTLLDQTSVIPTRQHSIIEIIEEKYEELNIVNDDEIISNISTVFVPEPEQDLTKTKENK